jgi:peptidoglycan-N-acetylglucosamine deacetylase
VSHGGSPVVVSVPAAHAGTLIPPIRLSVCRDPAYHRAHLPTRLRFSNFILLYSAVRNHQRTVCFSNCTNMKRSGILNQVLLLLVSLFAAVGFLPGQQRRSGDAPVRDSSPFVIRDQRHRVVDSATFAPPGFVYKVPPRLQPTSPEVFFHGPRNKKLIALTFDACATLRSSRYEDRITDILIELKIPATVFLGGKWMEEETEATKRLASLPEFELANHTFLHPHLKDVSDERIRQELRWTQEIMYSLTGRQPTCFRPPYGEYDERVVRIAGEMGLTTVQYDLASGDPDSSISKQRLVEYVSSMTRNGSVIVMHINHGGWHTLEALPEIITRLRKRGFTFVTVSELIAVTHQKQEGQGLRPGPNR